MATRPLHLHAFVQAADPSSLRIIHRYGSWVARSGDAVLKRPDDLIGFGTLQHLLEVLASVGIRSCVVEWDGLEPREDRASGLDSALIAAANAEVLGE